MTDRFGKFKNSNRMLAGLEISSNFPTEMGGVKCNVPSNVEGDLYTKNICIYHHLQGLNQESFVPVPNRLTRVERQIHFPPFNL